MSIKCQKKKKNRSRSEAESWKYTQFPIDGISQPHYFSHRHRQINRFRRKTINLTQNFLFHFDFYSKSVLFVPFDIKQEQSFCCVYFSLSIALCSSIVMPVVINIKRYDWKSFTQTEEQKKKKNNRKNICEKSFFFFLLSPSNRLIIGFVWSGNAVIVSDYRISSCTLLWFCATHIFILFVKTV